VCTTVLSLTVVDGDSLKLYYFENNGITDFEALGVFVCSYSFPAVNDHETICIHFITPTSLVQQFV
jgi:hypothetical protein